MSERGRLKARWVPLFLGTIVCGVSPLPASPAIAQSEPSQREADGLFAEGERLRNQGTAQSVRGALEPYEQALALFRGAGDRVKEAETLTNIGRCHDFLGDKQKALAIYAEALPLHRAAGQKNGEASTLNYIALVYDYLGERPKALETLAQALPLARDSGDRHVEANTLNNIGLIHHNTGGNQTALEYYQQALAIHRTIGHELGQATNLLNIAGAYEYLGDKKTALDYLGQALALYRRVGTPHYLASTLNNMGTCTFYLDKAREALDLYGQALDQWRATGELSGTAATLHNMAHVYESIGEYQLALEHYEKALPLHRASNYRAGEGNTLTNLGRLYFSLGDPDKALDCYTRALALHRAVNNRTSEATTLTQLGNLHASRGDSEKALGLYNEALSLTRATGDRVAEAILLNRLGGLHASSHRLPEAVEAHQQALALYSTIGSPRGQGLSLTLLGVARAADGHPGEAIGLYDRALPLLREGADRSGEAHTLFQVARAERARGNLAAAERRLESALAILESLRSKVARQDLRASYFASVQDYYEMEIDLLMQRERAEPGRGFAGAALLASERARARGLLDILTEAQADIRQGVDPALLDRERSLQQALDLKAGSLNRLLSGKHSDDQAAAAAREVDNLTSDYQDAEARIRQTSPRYAALTQPEPLSLERTQREVLDEGTELLEFALGTERSYLWAVTPNSIISFDLPGRVVIEGAARRFANLASRPGPIEEAHEAASALGRLLLAPASASLGTKRLVIVAAGALQYVPFAALSLGAPGSYRPLILDHEVVSLPSAAALALLRGETAGRARAKKTLAVLADPVFRTDDPRVDSAPGRSAPSSAPRAEEGASKPSSRDLERAAVESGVAEGSLRFPRLIGSRREAARIAALVPEADRLAALDFEASRATVTSSEFSQYRIVHLATHGLLDSVHPELSGVVLSLVDKRGEPQDGFLRLHDIYNLRLSAELVVLSACQSALGKEIKGDGLVSVTRGFMYAGAPRVVASLWKVDDAATADLMARFYAGMLGSGGLRPAAALRSAQLTLAKERRWQAPYYWAPFVLQGEWR
jgi:CHAT domain-containing protein/Tfp pilus assembly protein PilF